MASRTLDQILADINAKTDPQRSLVLNQIADIPKQQAAEEAGLKAQEQQGYTDILDGARRRGLGFSGIPLGEQAQYHASQYLPAVAKLKTSFNDRQNTLQGTLASLDANNYAQANDIYNQERNFAEQQRQFDLNYALQKQSAAGSAGSGSALASLFGGSAASATPAAAKLVQRADKGFNFTDGAGQSISAAQYAQLKGIPFRDLLTDLAKAGDKGAQQALGFVGNDLGYDPSKIGNLGSLYNALVWGTGRSFTGGASAPLNVPGLKAAGQQQSLPAGLRLG